MSVRTQVDRPVVRKLLGARTCEWMSRLESFKRLTSHIHRRISLQKVCPIAHSLRAHDGPLGEDHRQTIQWESVGKKALAQRRRRSTPG